MISSSFGSDHPEQRTAEKHGAPPGQIMANSGQKVVLITGCSSGIGLRIAVTLARDEKKRYHGKCAFFLHCFFNRTPLVARLRSCVSPGSPSPCLLSRARLSHCAQSLLYAQSSVEFHAQLSVFGGQISELAWCPL